MRGRTGSYGATDKDGWFHFRAPVGHYKVDLNSGEYDLNAGDYFKFDPDNFILHSGGNRFTSGRFGTALSSITPD